MIRIIGGQWRGRTLVVPTIPDLAKKKIRVHPRDFAPPTSSPRSSLSPAPILRPSTDRVRTTLFNWLNHLEVIHPNTQVLDLYCGTGILGLEALSRGAAHCTFVDNAPPLIDALKSLWHTWHHHTADAQNKVERPAPSANSRHTHFIVAYAEQAINQFSAQQRTFDLIFCDPPYRTTQYDDLLKRLATVMSASSMLYCEAGQPLTKDINPLQWRLVRDKKISSSYCYLLQRTDIGSMG